MRISEELSEKINILISNDDKLKEKLLVGDADAIQRIGIMSDRRISSEDIVEAYENNNIDELYEKAKKTVELRKVYKELCNLYAKRNGLEER